MPPDQLNALLEFLQAAQHALRSFWQAIGLGSGVAGQPAWPWSHRLAAEMLAIDGGHARRVVLALAAVAGVVALGVAGLVLQRRQPRWAAGLWLAGGGVLLCAPWPQAHLLLAPAVPTSLHQSPTGFSAHSIVQGRAVYQQHCARCHGTDARGEGPEAAHLPVWPPMLTGGLLWKRLEGELFWRVRHGLHDRQGQRTMPGVPADRVSDRQIWQVLDYLQAHAAGQMLRESGAWERPVRLPDMALDCRQGRRRVTDVVGQRLRLAVAGVAGSAGEAPADDPRFLTLQAGMGGAAAPADCTVADPDGLPAIALVLGVPPADLAGHQLLVDRAGWLRARATPGQSQWSEDDLVCKAASAPSGVPGAVRPRAPGGVDGLDALIRRMDAEPVRLVRGGFPHG